jgi:hypothetical protein
VSEAFWKEGWFASIAPARRLLWRAVEAQHQVATMKLVDDLDEQLVLEQLLEAGKPAPPPMPAGGGRSKHWLLWTPFRYTSQYPSRFRRPGEPGVWYGADDTRTVAAEMAHWRRRFLLESDGLRERELVVQFTFFQARMSGLELDLTQPPWTAKRSAWRDPEHYGACHRLAASLQGREPRAHAVRYESARLEGGTCEAVFDPAALAGPVGEPQTWACKISARRVTFRRDREGHEFEFTPPG